MFRRSDRSRSKDHKDLESDRTGRGGSRKNSSSSTAAIPIRVKDPEPNVGAFKPEMTVKEGRDVSSQKLIGIEDARRGVWFRYRKISDLIECLLKERKLHTEWYEPIIKVEEKMVDS